MLAPNASVFEGCRRCSSIVNTCNNLVFGFLYKMASKIHSETLQGRLGLQLGMLLEACGRHVGDFFRCHFGGSFFEGSSGGTEGNGIALEMPREHPPLIVEPTPPPLFLFQGNLATTPLHGQFHIVFIARALLLGGFPLHRFFAL